MKIIAPFAAGGPSDFVARLLADKLSQSLGQQFYVEDHPGAGGNIGMTQVAAFRARRLRRSWWRVRASWSIRAFTPTSPTIRTRISPRSHWPPHRPISCSAHPSVPAKTVKELIALLQANPGKYAIANAGLGTTPQLASELFKLDFKLDQPSVPYGGGAPAIQAVIANQTPIGFANLTAGQRRTSWPGRCTASP